MTSYTYTAKGQQETVTTPEGRTTTYEYDTQGNRVAEISPEGRRSSSAYDAYGRRVSQTTARGHEPGAEAADYTTTYGYDAADNLVSTTDPLGNETTYVYDLAGQQTSVTDPLGQETVTGYDAAGNVVAVTDPAGGVTTHEYDAAGDRISTTDPEGGTTTWTYDADGRQSSMTTARGNEPGADPADFTWSYTYDGLGNMLTESDPEGGTVSYGYDERYLQTTVTNQAGETTEATYDGDGNPVHVTDPLGRVTETEYNDRNLPIAVTDPSGNTGTMTYDADGVQVSETTPLGNITTYTYDDDGRLVSFLRPTRNGNVWRYAYDADGHRVRSTDPMGRFTTATYDRAGRVMSSSRWNVTTTYAHDAAGRLTSVTGGDGAVTEYDYNPAGDLVTVTDANGHSTTHTYDQAHRRTSTTDQLGRTTTFGYDAEGNQTSKVLARGQASGDTDRWTITNTYDALGRRTEISTASAGSSATFTYDAVGRLTGTTDTTGTTTLAYDDAGQLSAIARSDGSDYTYTYDPRGLVESVTRPDDFTITKTYDEDRRLVSTESPSAGTTEFTYDRNSNLTRIEHLAGDGMVNRWQRRYYDTGDSLTGITTGTGATTEPDRTVAYSRDGADRPFVIRRGAGGVNGPAEFHQYGPAGRLTKVCYDAESRIGPDCADADETITYTYDGVGNRLTEERAGGSNPGVTTYTYDAADQLTSRGSTGYSYDADGNLTSDGATTWTYDELNRLTHVDTTSQESQLNYDGLGNRANVTTDGTTRTLRWDINNPLPLLTGITAGDGATSYRYGPDAMPLNATIDGTNHALLTNDQHSIITAIDRTTGDEAWASTYEPFGALRGTTNNSLTTAELGLTYTGEYLDPSTELLHLRLRDYDPATGQFTSKDPVNTPTGIPSVAPYAYVDNQPTTRTDPSGACWQWSWCADLLGDVGESIAGTYRNQGPPTREELISGFGLGYAEGAEEAVFDTIAGNNPARFEELFGWGGSYFDSHIADTNNPWMQWSSYAGEAGFWSSMAAAGQLSGAGRSALSNISTRPCPPGLLGKRNLQREFENLLLGRGSTGRNQPESLAEELAMRQAISDPLAGGVVPIRMTDPRWPAEAGWVKMQININGIKIHYVRNTDTRALDDFKFIE